MFSTPKRRSTFSQPWSLIVVEFVDDHAHAQAKKAVELSHPLRVAFGQVIVDGDYVYAIPGERVEVDRKGGDKGLSFTGFHLGDVAPVQDNAADQLDVEMAHVEHAPAGLTGHGEGFRQDFF